MSSIKIIAFILTFSCILGCKRIETLPSDQPDSPSASEQNETRVIKHLLVALRPEEKSARFNYRGVCEARNPEIISFPSIKVEAPQQARNTLLRVQEVLSGNRDITVTAEQSGMIRIKKSGVSGAILQTRIANLSLNLEEQYNPSEAIGAIEHTKEVQSTMRQLDTRPAELMVDRLEVIPAKGRPHLERSMENVTVDQALDRILDTFHGIVVYSECTQPNGANLFSIIFDGE